MNLQQAFDIAYNGVVKQGKPSVRYCTSGRTECVFNGPDGTHCAIGFLILEPNYLDDICILPGNFFEDIRNAHDESAPQYLIYTNRSIRFVTEFKHRMSLVAKKWNLNVPS